MIQESARNTLIGVFVLAAVCLLVFFVLFLHPRVGDSGQKLRARFVNVEKVARGTLVTLAGRPIGQVVAVRQVPDAREGPVNRQNRPYLFEVDLAIDSAVAVYDTDQVVINTTGLFGERNITIVPMKPPSGVTPKRLTATEVIYAKSGDQMQDIFAQVLEVTEKISKTFDKIYCLIDANTQNITEAIRSIKLALSSINRTFCDINEQELVFSLKDAADRFVDVMVSLDQGLCCLDREKFWSNLCSSFANFRQISDKAITVTDNLQHITSRLANGQGTLGRLLTSDELYLRTLSIMGKGETLMNDINHYGLLFHLNRGWKRQRTQRAAMLSQLETPSQFRAYFDCELNQITTSLSRVSMLIQKAQDEGCCQNLVSDPCFSHSFGDLIRQVQSLEDRLQLYNQYLIQCDSFCP